MPFQPSVNQVHTLFSKLAFRQYFYNLLLPVDYFDRFKGNLRKCVNIRHIRHKFKMTTSKTNWIWNCVNFKEVIKVLSILMIARKMYVALYCYNHNMDGPYPKINQTLLQIEFESEQGYGNDSFWIIDQKIRAVNEVAYLKDDSSLSILVVILSAPKNFDKRQITRKHLQSVAHRGVKWAFILGQTSKDVQVELENEMQKYGDILQLSISDGYQHVPYKTLSAYAWSWLTFKDRSSLEWIIKLDDDLDLKMDKIIDKLPMNLSGDYPYIHCPCIMRRMPPTREAKSINGKYSVSQELWPFEGRYPSYCNGYMYALKPKTAMKLASVSRETPFLPLDDIFVTGVLRDRLQNPQAEFKLLNRFDYGTSWLEWCLHCPFLGVGYYAFVQDVAYQRDYWPWQAFEDMSILFIERYFGVHLADNN